MNLSIAAIIDGLKAAKRDEEFIITGSQIDGLINLWSEYDPKATGWITVESLAFLIFELPPPIGLGKTFPEANYFGDKVFQSKQKHNQIESTLQTKMTKQLEDDTPIMQIEDGRIKYMFHTKKKILMKETKMMQILGKFAIPVYKNAKVHFKDICKQIIKNIFAAKNMEVQANEKIEKRIKTKWNRRYKSLK